MTQSSPRERLLLMVAVLCALVSVSCFALPMYVIWPFRHQGATELAIALFTKRLGPWLSLSCAAICLVVFVFMCLRRSRWIPRITAIFALVAGVSGAYLSRVNVYEWMFHPLGVPAFEPAARAKLEPGDMVIAIHVNGLRRAYPIREMAYHHVVNDTLGGEALVATY